MLQQGYYTHKVLPGESIQSIAYMYDTDWTSIAELNNLNYPFIDSTINSTAYIDNSRVAKVGTLLLIKPISDAIQRSNNITVNNVDKYSYGEDLSVAPFSTDSTLNMDDNLELTDSDTNDLDIASGVNNIHQQILLRLKTPKGALILHPDFGSNLNSYRGLKTTSNLLTKIKLEVKRCILIDSRIQEVKNLVVTSEEGGIIRVSCDIYLTPPGDKIISFNETI